jgi:hypothetical protein
VVALVDTGDNLHQLHQACQACQHLQGKQFLVLAAMVSAEVGLAWQ